MNLPSKLFSFDISYGLNNHWTWGRSPSIQVTNLKERRWHNFCIASIDNEGVTSPFVCKYVLTDFATTGPVTNVKASSESDNISISWHVPKYKYDVPQGYIVNIFGSNGFCREIIIKLVNNNCLGEINVP